MQDDSSSSTSTRPMSAELSSWITQQEFNPGQTPTPKQRIESAIRIAEQVAYTKGLLDGLDRLERITLLIPNARMSARTVVTMAQNELRDALAKWRQKFSTNEASE